MREGFLKETLHIICVLSSHIFLNPLPISFQVTLASFFHKASPCFISPPLPYFFFPASTSCRSDDPLGSINWTLMVSK